MKTNIGFEQALKLTREAAVLMPTEQRPLAALCGRVLAVDAVARVDVPACDASLKDGYAVRSGDVHTAAKTSPVRLRVIGSVNAGGRCAYEVGSGQAVRITTGAPLPAGAQAVLAEELCQLEGEDLLCLANAEPGRNVLRCGTDVSRGETLVRRGRQLTPPVLGLLAAAGLESATVFRRPTVAVIAAGDEIVAPGRPLPDGKLYASNLVEICAWCSWFGLEPISRVTVDQKDALGKTIEGVLQDVDALVTSGGAWTSEKDLTVEVFSEMGWRGIYHRVRMGPGKGVGFGLLGNKPVFCLPGGPPSNEMAFLQLALPGILQMQRWPRDVFAKTRARLRRAVSGQGDWTQFIHARLDEEGGEAFVEPMRNASRLRSMADKQGLIVIPEGRERLEVDERVEVQVLHPPARR